MTQKMKDILLHDGEEEMKRQQSIQTAYEEDWLEFSHKHFEKEDRFNKFNDPDSIYSRYRGDGSPGDGRDL